MNNEPRQVSDIKTQKKVISWQAPEFTFYSKKKSWYVLISILTLGIAIIFLISKLYPAVVVTIVGGIVLMVQANTKPRLIKYSLDESGITAGEKNYPFEELKSFWVGGESVISKLYLEKTRKIHIPLVIHLVRVNPEDIKEFLQRFLPEKVEIGEHIDEKISRFLHF